MTSTPTPTTPRPITEHLRDFTSDGPEPIGEMTLRLVLVDADADPTPGAWAITHQIGSVANGTHTEVAFVDDTTAVLPERLVDDMVRQIAGLVYPGRWAFHYRPQEVAGSVLAYGTRVRERIEVSAVQVREQ